QEVAGEVRLGRQNRIKICVGDHSADFFREKEECFLAVCIVNTRNKYRPSEGPAKIIVPERWTIDPSAIVEEIVGIQDIISKELVQAPVKLAGARPRNYVDLAAGAAAIFRIELAPHDAKFLDGIYAGVSEQSQIGPAIHVVGAVHRPIVLRWAAPIHG